MKIVIEPKDIDVLILCGGLGTRLRPLLPDRPKGLAEVNNRPFLEYLIDYFSGAGFRRFILCVGYKGEQIREYFKEKKNAGREILLSQESVPLGTAGALKNAAALIKSDPFLVTNGDTFFNIDFARMLAFHFYKNALLTMAVSRISGSEDAGAALLSDEFKVLSYRQRAGAGKGSVNMGVYIMKKEVLDRLPEGKEYSLERNLFPALAGGDFFGFDAGTKILDIGTPERYNKANDFLRGKG